MYVPGIFRKARAHRLRAPVADLTGVEVRHVADVDRFSITAAVTVVATAADTLRAAVRAGSAAKAPRLLQGADPWSVELLGSRNDIGGRRQLKQRRLLRAQGLRNGLVGAVDSTALLVGDRCESAAVATAAS
eukprot:contig_18182_g4452